MGKKSVTVILDLVLLAAVILAVYKILQGSTPSLFSLVIVVAIPVIFVITVLTFFGDRFDREPEELFSENEEKMPEKSDEKESPDESDSSDDNIF